MRRKFVHEYEDKSPSAIAFSYEDGVPEVLRAFSEGDEVVIEVNRTGAGVLAALFAELSQCDFKPGFHVHVYRDFDADTVHVLRVQLAGG